MTTQISTDAARRHLRRPNRPHTRSGRGSKACCDPAEQISCCAPAAKTGCCGDTHAEGCGCK